MHSMRDIMRLVEGKGFPTVNGDETIGRIMSLMSVLQGAGFEFKADWVADAVAAVKQDKLEAEAGDAEQRLKDETEGETVEEGEEEAEDGEEPEEASEEPESTFDAQAALGEAVDAIAKKGSHAGGILSDIVTAERMHKDEAKVDPDNLGQEIEESNVLTCLAAQRDIVEAVQTVVPSKPSTFGPVLDGVDLVLEIISKNKDENTPEFVASLKKELEHLLPLMRFTLKNL